MKEFGQTCYANYVYFNFDEEDELKSIFQANKNPHRIIELLSMISGEKIQPGETLILFDEIQECPEALNTLDIFPLTFDEFLEAIDPAIYPYYDGIQKRTTDKNSEIDFVLQNGTDIIPVEVKAGEDKSAPSFKRYVAENHPAAALRFSKRGYRKDGDITNLPLYLVCKTRDLL